MKKFYLLTLIATIGTVGCGDPNKFTSESGDPHDTKIIVKLGGKYAAEYLVDVTIGTGGVTTIGKDLPPEAYATVDPGTYSVKGTVHGFETGVFAHSTTVEQGQQKTILFNLNDAKLVFKTDPLFIGTHNEFRVTVHTDDGPSSFLVNAGGTAEHSFRPGKTGNQIDIINANTGQVVKIDFINVFFGGTLTYTLNF